ncbi:MAG: hypothetical protein JNK26_02360 [Candidatus Doudnabacteria bacterium]|nr:hypothetical protein [Candidatus Doudnabacteria bacterium]
MGLKSVIIPILNFAINPVLFVDYLIWSKQLNYTPFKRRQYSLFSANAAMFPFWKYGYQSVKKQALIISVIFDVDYYLDQVVGKTEGYEQVIETVYDSGKYKGLVEDVVRGLPQDQATEVANEIKRLTVYAAKLDHTDVHSIQEYLDLASITIAMPCLAMIAGFTLKEEPADTAFIKLSSDITRIVNDRANRQKDAEEGTKNIYNLFGRDEVNSYLGNAISEFRKFEPKKKVEQYMKTLTELGLKLYKEKDFEL